VYACGKPQATQQVVNYYQEGVLEMSTEVEQVTEAYLKALTLKEQADEACEEARQLLIDTLAGYGVSEVECGEVTVKVSPTERRTFDVDKLRGQVSAPLFRAITKPSVDTSAFDRAVSEGKLTSKVIKACVKTSHSVRVLVRATKGAEKPIASKTA
jgi:hypothetical protein